MRDTVGDLEVIDGGATTHHDATAVASTLATPHGEAVPQSRGSREFGILVEHSSDILTIEDASVRFEIALTEIIVVGFVAREATVDIHTLADGEASIVGAFGDPHFHGITIHIIVCLGCSENPIQVAGGHSPRGAVAGALGGHIVAILPLGQGGEDGGAPA